MIRQYSKFIASLFTAILLFSSSCASDGADEQVEDPTMEEFVEDSPQQDENAESYVDDSPAVDDSASLASELDQLSLPAVGETQDLEEVPMEEPLPGASDSLVETSPSMMDEPQYVETTQAQALPQIDGDVSEYIVQPGDTLGGISAKVYGSPSNWPQLAQDNALSNPGMIYPGDIIRYRVNERAQGFKTAYEGTEQEVIMVQAGDTLSVIAQRLFGRSDYWKPIWHLNKTEIPNPNVISPGQIIRYVDPKKIAQSLQDSGLNTMSH